MHAPESPAAPELHKTERLRGEIVERVYATFLADADRLSEPEWRMAAIECAMRLLRGVECSAALDADIFAPAALATSAARSRQLEIS